MPPETPLGYGLHPNAEIDYRTVTVTSIKLVVGELVLTLAEGDGVEHLLGVEALGSSEELDVLDWVHTRRQDEVDGGGGGRIAVGTLQNLLGVASGVTIDELVTVGHDLAEIGRASCRERV